ncbi:cell death regulator Aven [Labeo rohita]|uniref:cell death regulator Aven n=1 Tax=Labeo rohita TaxID=84645 RepID=UPI0021E20DAD|nr:cell death regulator Aven [Labeo rohita]
MEFRHSRGRGGHWKRGGRGGGGGGGGDAETGSAGEHRGRGRGSHHHRGRGKRDHRRGRGREFGPPADFRRHQDDQDNKENFEQEEEDHSFSRRKLESNWDRYEETEKEEINEDVPSQRGTDYQVLLTSAGDSFTQFRFSDEKDWEMDSLAKNQIPALFIDLPALTQSLQELPLHTRLNLEAELVQVTLPVELPSVTVPHRTDSTLTTGLKAPQAGRESNLSISCSVKPVSSTTPSLGVSTAIPPATDDADQELDLLLNLQKPVTEMTLVESHTTTDDVLNNPTQGSEEERKDQKADMKETKPEVESEAKPTRQDVTEEDLEDWLDSMIS